MILVMIVNVYTLLVGSFTSPSAPGYGATPGFQRAGYLKDDNGRVHLRGQLLSGGVKAAGVLGLRNLQLRPTLMLLGSGTLVFTLPAGYRPVRGHAFVVNSYSSSEPFLRVDVLASGEVKVCHVQRAGDVC